MSRKGSLFFLGEASLNPRVAVCRLPTFLGSVGQGKAPPCVSESEKRGMASTDTPASSQAAAKGGREGEWPFVPSQLSLERASGQSAALSLAAKLNEPQRAAGKEGETLCRWAAFSPAGHV